MKIRKSAVMQYILIYIMLMIPGSCMFAKYLTGNLKYIVLLGFYAILIVLKKKYRSKYTLLFVGLMLLSVVVTRFLNGGAGITAWFQFAVCLLSTQMAIYSERESFLRRWLQVLEILAVISIVFWAAFCIAPGLVDAWPAVKYFTQAIGTKGWQTFWHGKGVLLYSHLEIHPTRNCGIYTEPGVYQIVLNSALFVLLFWKDKIKFSCNKRYLRCLFIILLALITCQSTTGYIGMLINLLFFLVMSQKQYGMNKMKLYLVGIICIGGIALVADYASRGNDSILYMQIIQKLFGGNGSGLDISQGTGQYRMGTIIVSINTVLKNPLGVGYDAFDAARDAYAKGLVAASVVAFPAIYGVIPWIIAMGMIFVPVIKREKHILAILFIFLFLNTTLAQTDLFYPSLMMIPIYLIGQRIQVDYKLEEK